ARYERLPALYPIVTHLLRRHPTLPLFPYTTLFRSHCTQCHVDGGIAPFSLKTPDDFMDFTPMISLAVQSRVMPPWHAADGCTDRSEEHTSELQSRENLVCRLLLEKKKNTLQ